MEKQQTFGPIVTARSFKDHVKSIVGDPYIAMVELISNSWDAGAENVKITWPEETGGEMIIEDDGEGMSKEEFLKIWRTLGYNRTEKQGREVTHRTKRIGYREAYGKNGKGRHAPFCFAEIYNVETWKNNECSHFKIKKTIKKDLK
ncbi:MAG: ATP-binding protein [Methanobrevibacter sp.]|jgi:HSP90 family molecular chaperone|nr:ATP-binding protein [Methanobrevibacter sp.]